MKQIFLAVFFIFAAFSVKATDRHVDTGGADSSDCTLVPCLTLQYAIDQSNAGDTVVVNAGTFAVSGLVNINKSLNLLGAQAGVDARSRAGAESILSNAQGIFVSASNVVINGFTIQDSNVSAYTGYGVWINPGVDGTQIVNNIITNNIVGLGLANQGSTQALVQYNLFQGNNLPGAASGTGIYTDQYVGGQVSNVLITENTFENNANAAIGLSSEDAPNPTSNINITNNSINNCGRGIYLFNTVYSNIENNYISNLTAPADGGSSAAIGIYGGVTNLSVIYNNLNTGAKYGLRIGNLSGALSGNTDLSIHTNNISGFAIAGMHVDNAPTTPIEYATCNYWGQSSGPEHPSNPSGIGDVISGDVVLANFSPWLIDPAPFGACGTPPEPEYISVSKVFAPAQIYKGERTTLVITLTNDSDNDAVITAPLLDILPFGLEIKGTGSNTCDGELIAQRNGRTIILSDGVIPNHGFCSITVSVKGLTDGLFTNTIPINALQTDQGNNTYEASATLNVIKKNHNGF
jgi:hypothetical protein